MVRFIRFLALFLLCVFLHSASLCGAQSSKNTEGLTYSSFHGQPVPSHGVLFDLIRQIRWDTPRAGDLDPQGLRLRFEKIDDQATPAAGPARYRVFADGAPENKVYTLGIWLVGKELSYGTQDIYTNSQGLVMIHRPTDAQETSFKAPGDELDVMPEAGTAEPIRYILSSKDQQLSIEGTLVPHPVIARDQGCSLEVRIAEPNASAVLLIADGFPGQTKIPLVLESEGENASLTMMTDSGGHAAVVDFPSVLGKAQGTLKATAEGSNCLPSIRLPWGAGILAKKTQ